MMRCEINSWWREARYAIFCRRHAENFVETVCIVYIKWLVRRALDGKIGGAIATVVRRTVVSVWRLVSASSFVVSVDFTFHSLSA